jgi:hypothetical protein
MNENIISKNDRDFILKFIEINKDYFQDNPISQNRKFLILEKKINPPNLFSEIKKKILIKENILNNYIDDSPYGDYIGYISNGGKIHKHIDPTIAGYDHVRFNLFLSLPKKGGLPIYNDVTIPVKVGDYVKCNSSKEYHECQIVESDIPRIVISYGIFLKIKKDNYFNYT